MKEPEPEIQVLPPAQGTSHSVQVEPMQLEEAPQVSRSKAKLTAVLIALYLSLFLAALEQSIISTVSPTISAALHSGSGYVWISGAYSLASAVATPVFAKLSDIWGRRLIMLTAVALFFISSLVCALSVSMTMLIAGRAFQGMAGGGTTALVMIIISDLFSMKQRTFFFGVMEIMWALAAGLAPVLGGVFAEVNWRLCFYINLPISGLAFVLLFFVDVHNPRTGFMSGLRAIDWAGMFAILGFVLMLLLGLEFGGGVFAWDSPKVICLIIFGALFSLVFIYAEKRIAKYPVIPLRLFKIRSNVAALIITLSHFFVFIAANYWLPLYFQAVKDVSPLRSGVLLIPLLIGAAVFAMLGALIMSKTSIGYRGLIWAGTLTLTLGAGLQIMLNTNTSIATIVTLQMVFSIGAGLLFQPPLISVQAHTAQDDIATATATIAFARDIAITLSIVIGGVIFQNGMKQRTGSLVAAGAMPDLVHLLGGAEAAANTQLIHEIQDKALKRAVQDAFAFSLRNMWIMYTCVAVVGLIASAFISGQELSTEHRETRTGLKKESQ